MKAGFAAAALSGVAATGAAFQDQLEWAKSKLMGAPAADPTSTMALANAITEWHALTATGSVASFDRYATFLIAHQGWPNEAQLKRAAESSLALGGWSPSTAIAYFQIFPPMTGAAWVRYAEALSATGNVQGARNAARNAWVAGALPVADEAKVIAGWSDALTQPDQDRRMDMLLWQGSTQQAARQLVLTSPDRRAGFATRLAYRTNGANAATASEDGSRSDAGLLADRSIWLANSGAAGSARSLLARTHRFDRRPADVRRWYDLMLKNARAAVAAGDSTTAFEIARQVDDAYPDGTDISLRPYGERDAFTDLTWLAGTLALKRIARPGEAIGMFLRYAGGSRSPALKTKGLYWAARAAEAAGKRDEARDYLNRAAQYRDQFYGQLATERLGTPLVAPANPGQPVIDPVARTAFYRSEVVRAAQYLGTTGAHEDQSAFIRAIANNASSDSDHALAAELSRTLGRPDLAVMIGRSALLNGLDDYTLTGFPTVNVPASASGMWSIVHGIMRQESQFDRAAISRVGARGLMQLMPGSAREQAGKLGVAWDSGMLTTSTDYNIQLGSAYFQRLYTQYGSYPLAIAAYNAGAGNVNKWLAANGDPRMGGVDWLDWIEAIPFDETKRYVQHVLENAVVYDLINPQRAMSTSNARLSWYIGNKRPG